MESKDIIFTINYEQIRIRNNFAQNSIIRTVFEIVEMKFRSIREYSSIKFFIQNFPFSGSEDIRAHETPRISRPYSSYLDSPATYRSIFDEPATANERVQSHGYRYLPVSRDTYGYSPRAIYDHHYSRTSKCLSESPSYVYLFTQNVYKYGR